MSELGLGRVEFWVEMGVQEEAVSLKSWVFLVSSTEVIISILYTYSK